MQILITIPVTEKEMACFRQAAPEAEFTCMQNPNVTEEMIAASDIIIGNVPTNRIKASPRLKLLQLNSAGSNEFCVPGVLSPNTILCNATGAYGVALAEHMLAQILMLIKKLNMYEENRKNHIWRDEGGVTGIYGSTTLVIGAGDIGTEFGRRMAGLGSRVIGIRRHKVEPADYMIDSGTMEDIDRFLPEADFVACALPATKETYHLFDRERVGRMKKTAVLANIGRGNLIETEVLADALKNHVIAGACIDVTDPEPLPEDSILWDCPNLILTPHISGFYHLRHTYDRIIEIACSNLAAFVSGGELINQVDFETGYRKF
ncbi:MAG: D-2-hydroxyacid dehydrogenase [Lachnospiraceae bacterium]|nr:D-2-hydroxyacid dehydrogenase [Lachnospiraceae bacterium]